MFAPSTAVRRGFAVALAAVLVTSGCAAGRDAQTQNQVPSQDGTDANVGTMALRGVALEEPTSGASYPPGSAIALRLVLVNNATSDDRLTGVTSSVARSWASYGSSAQASAAASSPSATSSSPITSSSSSSSSSGTGSSSSSSSSTGSSSSSTPSVSTSTSSAPSGQTSVTIPTGQRVSWGVPDSSRVLLLLSSVRRVYAGSTVKITFTFAKAGSVTVPVPVQLAPDQAGSTISAPAGSSG